MTPQYEISVPVILILTPGGSRGSSIRSYLARVLPIAHHLAVACVHLSCTATVLVCNCRSAQMLRQQRCINQVCGVAQRTCIVMYLPTLSLITPSTLSVEVPLIHSPLDCISFICAQTQSIVATERISVVSRYGCRRIQLQLSPDQRQSTLSRCAQRRQPEWLTD